MALEGRIALVGGASRGIGRGCAEALAAAGATVWLAARDAETLEGVRASLEQPPGPAHRAVPIDFQNRSAVETTLTELISRAGQPLIVVNNTGGPAPGLATDSDPDLFAAAFEAHLLAAQTVSRLVVPGMKEAGYGRIINVISTSVTSPIAGLGVSNTIRGAMANWGRTLAAELGRFGITVNNILPGYIATERLELFMARRAELAGVSETEMRQIMSDSVPVGRLGTPADIGTVVAFLASPAAGYINGVNLPVDGGRLVALNN